jgi:hypothetical protein
MAVYKDPPLSVERVRELLHYEPDTGVFTRRIQRASYRAGEVAGFLHEGYWELNVDVHYVKAHRLAWFYVHGEWPDGVIDHINRDKLDNRLANLRVVTISENRQNMSKYRSNTSGHKGVHWFKAVSKWQAQIKHEGRRHHLGLFHDIEDAAAAYAKAAAAFHKYNPDGAPASGELSSHSPL